MWDKVSSSSSRHSRVAIVDRRRPAFTPTGWHCFINKWFSMVLRLVSGKESYKKYLLFWLFWLVAGRAVCYRIRRQNCRLVVGLGWWGGVSSYIVCVRACVRVCAVVDVRRSQK